MLYVFKPFWSLLKKGGEAYELIVFKRVHMGGCYIFSKWLQLSLLIHLVLWVVTLKLDVRLLLSLLFCDATINSACAMINPAWTHSADVHFSLCMSLFMYICSCMLYCLHTVKRISTSTICHVHLHSNAKHLYAHLQGEPFCHLWRQHLNPYNFTYFYPRWKLQPVCHQSPKRGRL